MTNIEKTKLGENQYRLSQCNNRKLLAWTSTAIALVLSACGRETRSTTEVPLADETSNTPTAFDDKLVGSDDLDNPLLLQKHEIYGFGGNDRTLPEQETIPFTAEMEMITFNQELAMIKFMVKEAMIQLPISWCRY